MADAMTPITVTRYVVNTASSIVTVLISMTVLVWVNQYLLRRIEPEEFALVPVLMSLLLIMETMRTVFTGGLSRFLVEAQARGDSEEVTRITSSMFPILLLAGLSVGALGGLAVWRIGAVIDVAPAYRRDAQIMLALLVAMLCVNLVSTPFRFGLYVHMRFVELNLITLGAELFRALLLIGLLFGVSTRAMWLVVASTSAGLLQVVILVALTRRVLPAARFRYGSISRQTIRRLLGFSLWTLVQGVTTLVDRSLPALLLNRHATAVDVTAFHVGDLPNQQIRRLTSAAAVPLIPALTSIYATDGEAALRPFYYRGGRYHLWITLFLVPPLLIFAQPLAALYAGETYSDAAIVMTLMLAGYPAIWASAMYYRVAYAIGRIQAFNISGVVLTGASAAGLVYFVVLRDMGAIGAAVGLIVPNVLLHLFVIWPFGLRLVGGRWQDFVRRTVAPGLGPFLAAVAAMALYGQAVPVTGWKAFFGACALSAFVYAGVLFGLCLDSVDRDLLRRARMYPALRGRGRKRG